MRNDCRLTHKEPHQFKVTQPGEACWISRRDSGGSVEDVGHGAYHHCMAFRVFLSYSLDPTEQAIAWRLQTLAAAHGIEMYVPQRTSPAPSPLDLPAGIRKAIEKSDCVLAIIATKPN